MDENVWHQDTRKLRPITDYLIIREEVDCKVKNVRFYRRMEFGSDHYHLKGEIIIPCKTIKTTAPKK